MKQTDTSERAHNAHEQKERAFLHCTTEAETVRGKNGRALFNEWHRPQEPEDCSAAEINYSHRVRGRGHR